MSRERLHFAMPRPVPPGRFRRVPPVMFLAILAALELALAWIAGVGAFALPPDVAQLGTGMLVALTIFALAAYARKLAWRPGVLLDELEILPGRAGVAAGVLSVYVLAALLGVVFGLAAGRTVLVAGMVLQAIVLAALIRSLRDAPAVRRRVAPDWHLSLAGLAWAAQAAMLLGWPRLSVVLAIPAAFAALAIWVLSARQLLSERVPAPLRPLLALHVAPLAVLSGVALAAGATSLGTGLAWLALAGVLAMGAGARWLLADGFSPLWAAPALALSATAWAWVMLWGGAPIEPHRLLAGGLLVLATLAALPVLALVMRDWARGRLPVKSNAAIA